MQPHRKEIGMIVVGIHHYTVDPADLEELLARRATLIAVARDPRCQSRRTDDHLVLCPGSQDYCRRLS
jgi:hypothetical protein